LRVTDNSLDDYRDITVALGIDCHQSYASINMMQNELTLKRRAAQYVRMSTENQQ
jgi:hypothetical protein